MIRENEKSEKLASEIFCETDQIHKSTRIRNFDGMEIFHHYL
jgi:hypothetical protein